MSLLALHILIGKNIIFISFICIALYLIINKQKISEKKIATHYSLIYSDTIAAQFISEIAVLNKYVIQQISAEIKVFFESYIELLMDKYDQGIFNIMIASRRNVLRYLNEFEQEEILGEAKTRELSELFMNFTWKYISVIVKKYELDFKFPLGIAATSSAYSDSEYL
jgi:hypothetical protein